MQRLTLEKVEEHPQVKVMIQRPRYSVPSVLRNTV